MCKQYFSKDIHGTQGLNEQLIKLMQTVTNVKSRATIIRQYADLYNKFGLLEDYADDNAVPFDAQKFAEIIDKIARINDLVIELVGKWLWIGGNTRDNKDVLKEVGCRYASKKQKWYWTADTRKRRPSKLTYEEIKDRFDYQTLKDDSDKPRPARFKRTVRKSKKSA